jgi:hypothetical protein
VTISVVPVPRTDDCEGLPAPQRVPDPIPFPHPPHTLVHTVPQPGCDLCPPTGCPCGVVDCPAVFDHARVYAGAEATVLERCA